MDRLNVYREVLGTYELVGSIERDGAADATFAYDSSYLANPTARPLSNSLPLDAKAADPRATLAFFEGLLPEGSIRKLFASAVHADAGDFPALLSRLSLAGAQTKIGLYHHGEDPASGWYLPQGSAPSTHILKVESPGGPFVGQTLNEALCLLTARRTAPFYGARIGARTSFRRCMT